ncbi:MAG: protein BatD [Cytophagales bacterium]|nr:MAG: protein BatD [Cytophagales bacterium]
MIRKLFQFIIINLLLVGFCSIPSIAQEPAFTANVSSNTVALEEQFQVSFSLNSSGKNFQGPSFEDFMVLSGPNQSQSMQFVNGNMSQSISYTYYLQPKNSGTFKIGSASILVNGKTLKTNPINITVSKSGNNKNSSNGKEESLQAQLSKNIFIKAVVNKTNPFRGEGIYITYKLYTRVDIVDLGNMKMPTLDGFWSQDLETSKELKLHLETIEGVQYNVADIKKSILFPQRSGSLTLDKMETEAVVRVRTQRKARSNDPFADFFDDPFFGGGNVQDVKYTVSSSPIKINVKALPENAPVSFSGAVGNFSMQAFLDKKTTKANEPITLKVKITGNGNLKLIDPIALQLPPDIESYEPKINDNISVSNDGVKGTRTFEYLLIPRREGQFKITPLEFSYFDLIKKTYINLSSEEFILNVTKGIAESSSSLSSSAIDKSDLALLGKDIRFIQTNSTNIKKKNQNFFGSGLFYTLSILPLIVFIGFIVFNKKQEQEASDLIGTKSKKATKIAKNRLSIAAKSIKQNNYEKAYEEISKALWGYISDKYKIPLAELNKEQAIASLLKGNIKQENIDELISLIDTCEFARYAPSSSIANAKETYQKSIEVISKIEQ